MYHSLYPLKNHTTNKLKKKTTYRWLYIMIDGYILWGCLNIQNIIYKSQSNSNWTFHLALCYTCIWLLLEKNVMMLRHNGHLLNLLVAPNKQLHSSYTSSFWKKKKDTIKCLLFAIYFKHFLSRLNFFKFKNVELGYIKLNLQYLTT